MRKGRGSSADRRARKLYLLAKFGDGETCRCHLCAAVLTYETVEADRIVPGKRGGTYRRSNIRPACRRCNASRGAKGLRGYKAATKLAS